MTPLRRFLARTLDALAPSVPPHLAARTQAATQNPAPGREGEAPTGAGPSTEGGTTPTTPSSDVEVEVCNVGDRMVPSSVHAHTGDN